MKKELNKVIEFYNALATGRILLIKINNLKQRLDKELETKNLDCKEILEISQQLDELIVEYCNQKIRYGQEN